MHRNRQRQAAWPWLAGVAVLAAILVGGGFWLGRRTAPNPSPRVVATKPAATKPAPALASLFPKQRFSGVIAGYRNGKRILSMVQGDGLSADTMFEIDSVQKSLTAGLVMQQVVAKKLRLQDKLARFYPQVPHAQEITVRELLDMTAGLTVKTLPKAAYTSDAATVHRVVNAMRYVPAEHGVGRYRPADYVVLVGILMQVTGRTYQQLFTAMYIDGLHLTHTRFAYEPNQSGEAVGHLPGKNGVEDAKAVTTSTDAQHFELGTGQLFMSTGDLFACESALLSGKLLPWAAVSWLFAPGSMTTTYGGGLYQQNGIRLANGYGYGFQCFLRMRADGKAGLVVMANCDVPGGANRAASDTLAAQWVYQ